ncbi:hypothetical protein HS088_TW01G00659 [Tripterygium wilfordii]|uniref:Uncharacterized protein n=1 Tax=Tripterygium wilfordii TaxID=458696 RepID=A0A7J7E251_TRIWF|nr:hypothetical protein HS088_TW01G00659 [Tripterygium wilfordii]
MDYALRATYGHLPTKLLCFPSTLKATQHKFNLSHSFHLLYCGSGFTYVPATKTLSPVIRAVDKSASPSSDDKRGGKILRGAVGASLVLACAIGVFSCSCNLKPEAIACPGDTMPSEYSTQVLGAKSAISSILEVSKNLITSNEKPLKNYKLPDKPSTADIRNLKGKYEEALKRDCLKSEVPFSKSDTRFFLYKAIVHAMLDNNDEAVKWWKKYVDTVGNGIDPNSPPIG